MKKASTFYSIIVPTYNRKDEIEELLKSLIVLDFPPDRFELIVADDGSNDNTDSLMELYQESVPFRLKLVRQQNKGPGAARNLGMKNASGDFFVFVDSDCTVSSDWLKAINKAIDRRQADAFGGPDSFRDDFPPLLKAINYSMTSFVTTGGLRGRKGKRLAKYYPRSFNMGLSRNLFEKVGGFGSLRHGQDIEFSNRIIKSGAKVIYISDAVVYHKRRTGIKKFFRQVFNWGVARVNLYKIDASMLEILHAVPAFVTLFLFLLIGGSALSTRMWFFSRWLFLAGLLVLLFSAAHAGVKYKSAKVFLLIWVIMPIQVLGYGLGFLLAFFYRVLLDRPEFVGFRKRYYK